MSFEMFVILLMTVGIVVFVGDPFWRRLSYSTVPQQEDRELEHLLLQKETLYIAIRDLDFDFQMSKMEQKDYVELRQELENDAVQVLEQIDAVDPLAVLDHELERQIMALRQKQPSPTCPSSSNTCSHCTASLEGDENFCPSCGQPLASL